MIKECKTVENFKICELTQKDSYLISCTNDCNKVCGPDICMATFRGNVWDSKYDIFLIFRIYISTRKLQFENNLIISLNKIFDMFSIYKGYHKFSQSIGVKIFY